MAPLSIVPQSVYSSDPMFKLSGARSFREFINEHASHLIVVLANVLRNGRVDGSNYSRLQHALEQYDKPIVVFGLGMQSATTDISQVQLPAEAISLMQFLSSRSEVLGVRGAFTQQVLEELCGVKNAMVTGCPSLYSRPEGLVSLREAVDLGHPRRGRFSFNVTNLARPAERKLLVRGVQRDGYLTEPVSRTGYEFHSALQRGESPAPPYYFTQILKDPGSGLTELRVQEFYHDRFRLFRHVDSWLEFNANAVSWSYGTRFHVNMASILSGVPAAWLTHDARTEELTSFMNLPRLSLSEAADLDPYEIFSRMDYEPFFDTVNGLFNNFGDYLEANGLPRVKSPF